MTPRKTRLERSLGQPQGSWAQDADDRRRRLRFSLRMTVKCARIGTRFLLDHSIAGEILNISSKGVLFTTSEAFLPGQAVRAVIDWPIRLHNRVRLTLVVEGAVVRSVGRLTAMDIERYQFKTRARGDETIKWRNSTMDAPSG
jgi:hypothetical protein